MGLGCDDTIVWDWDMRYDTIECGTVIRDATIECGTGLCDNTIECGTGLCDNTRVWDWDEMTPQSVARGYEI